MIQNGTPMGPGFFIFFNNLDVSPTVIFPSEGLKEKDDNEVIELVKILFTFLEGRQ